MWKKEATAAMNEFQVNKYRFKAVIEGFVLGESYLDALSNLFIPGMIEQIYKIKLKDIDIISEEEK